MTVPSWPTALPRPLRSSYRASATDPRLKRAQDAPVPAYRRRYSSVARGLQLSLVLSRAQKAVFDTFHTETTGFGTTPFWMPDPVTDGWPLLTPEGQYLLTPEGQRILLSARLLCVFGDEVPSETLRGMSFTVSFSVWVMP
ncbi:hypothetical protein [Salipiger profundus]|jgi:hypothetical protein|uniref:Uncharacterized protein n=1 Tax=Salipiger profundus TaxID=1229727 RepID=A0A1U7CZK6_9RHOB|nr:hypothetical protein [Salipiger profundus]APX21321.1 hypothetical protein Ga0080559_TMP525 [Salipiger profundus]GGA03279.1 hypothetical protein GCM10011326_13300 [Salipiger profundus]